MNRKDQQEHVQRVKGPTLHEPFLIGDRVKVNALNCEGTITGVGMHHVVCSYIVTVDQADAIEVKGYLQKASTFLAAPSMLTLIEEN